ncbi:MAG: hypothetical protein LC737_05725 [Chloroflexi bacterium]|nr:hypothetical protein [Chloroflexota bacterium]
MGHYHFEIQDGTDLPHPDPHEFASVKDARIEAVRLLAELVKDRPDDFWHTRPWRLILRDQSQCKLFEIYIHAEETPRAANE